MKLHNHFFLSILFAALTLCSCSKRSELLDTIPAGSQAVGMADLKKICADLDITLSETGAEIPAEIGQHLNLGDDANGVLDLIGRLDASGAADISAVAFAVNGDISFMTLAIDSWESLKGVDSPWLQWGEDTEGYHTGTLSRHISVVASDSQMWLLDLDPKAPVTVKKVVKEAEKLSISKLDAISQALTAGKFLTVVAPANGTGLKESEKADHAALLEASWTVASLNADGPRLVADVAMIKGTGEAVNVEGMQPVNPAVLSYVPGSCTLAVAAGLTPSFDWNFLNLLALLADDFQVRAALGVALPYLNSIDGTVLFAAAPSGENSFTEPDPSDWNFILMARLSQEKVDGLLGTIRTMLFTSGVSPRVEKDGIMVVPQYGTELYIGNVDGYFAVATFPFDNNRNNSLTPIFEGKKAAASFSIPSLSAISPDAPNWGVNLKAQFDGSKGQIELTLPGSEGNVLPNLLTLL